MRFLLSYKKSIIVPLVLLGCAALPMLLTSKKEVRAQEAKSPQATDPIVRISATKTKLKITKLFSKVIQMDRRIKRVDGFNPDVIHVKEMGTKAIRVHALEPGVTSLTLVDETNKVHSIEILVTGDVRHLQAYISELFPKDSVQAIEVRDVVLLRGWVQQPEHITELTALALEFYPRVLNQMKVGGEQQVVLRVKIMEAQRSKIRKMGFNFLYVNRNAVLSSSPGKLAPLGSLAASAIGVPPTATTSAATLADPTIAFGVVNQNNAFNGFLDALKEESLLKILAEPNLVATSGHLANMHSGGEFPILVPSSLGNVSIEFRPFGVKLDAVPIILGSGRVRLELHPSVSEKDFSTAVQAGNILVPGLKIRQANTTVEMKFGETLMIAGLIQRQQIATTSKVPVLGDMPWIGNAFSKKSYQDAETELVIMVTPELVAPIQTNQLLQGGPGLGTDAPTDKEFYIDNHLEVPSYGGRCTTCPPEAGRTTSLRGIAPTSYPSVMYPNSSGVTPSHPTRNGEFTPVPDQNLQIIPPRPAKTGPQIPPAPKEAPNGKTASRSRTPSRGLRSRSRSKYELPAWSRNGQQQDSFAAPDPARQVGFTVPAQKQQSTKTQSTRTQRPTNRSSSTNPFAARKRQYKNTELIEPSRNFFQR